LPGQQALPTTTKQQRTQANPAAKRQAARCCKAIALLPQGSFMIATATAFRFRLCLSLSLEQIPSN
jgi:hypothetical protein